MGSNVESVWWVKVGGSSLDCDAKKSQLRLIGRQF